MTSENAPFLLRPMREQDLEAVVAIHVESFPGSRSTRLGKPFLRKMYRWFLSTQPGLSIVATLKGQPTGFVTGAIGGSSRKIFRYAFWEVCLGFLRRPGLLLQPEMFAYWQSYLQGMLPRSRRTNPRTFENPAYVKATLDSIAVSPSARGNNLGRSLVEAFEGAAVQQGATVLALGVEGDNLAARHLYESCGWKLTKENKETNSANYSKDIRRT